jgi:hypothetical protein
LQTTREAGRQRISAWTERLRSERRA